MKNIFFAITLSILLNSCATIIGGAKYNAQVKVPNHPDARLYLNNKEIGRGSAFVKIRRQNAGNLNFEVRKEGYESQKYRFKSIKFRSGAFIGSTISSLFTWVTTYDAYGNVRNSFIFPIQLIIDLSNYSSLFKPDVNEEGVSKVDYKNYRYTLNYNPKPLFQEEKVVTKSTPVEEKNDGEIQKEKLRDLKKMYDERIIDEDEYRVMRRKILGISDEDFADIKTDSLQTKEVINTSDKNANTSETSKENINAQEEKKEDLIKTEDKPKTEKQELSKEDQEKLDDLNKMLELGVISQKEHDEMKAKLIDQK